MAQHWTNSATTTLNGAITNSATSLVVNTGDGALFPSSFPFRIRIDNEIIEVGARSTDTLSSLTRGVESTTAAAHSSGVAVKGVLTAGQLALLHQTGVAELTAADFASGLAVTRIDSQVLGSNQASITFSSIASTYSALLIEYTVRSTSTGAGLDTLLMQVNSDTGANYDYTNATDSSTVSSGETFGATSLRCGLCVQNGVATGIAASGRIMLPEYANTTFHKAGISEVASKNGTSAASLRYERGGLFWRSTAAITSITLFPGANSLLAGSIFRLWGIT